MNRRDLRSGFTLLELIIAMGIAVSAGGALFVVLHAATSLSAKNTAINVTHQQIRQAIHQSLREIHAAVSIPQLVDHQLQPLTGAAANGPAEGVSFQTLHAGPFVVWSNAAKNSTTVTLDTRHGGLQFADPLKKTGYRLIIPAFQVEEEIVNLTTSGNTTTVTLAKGIGANITCTNAEPAYVAYVTRRVAFAVVDGQLQRFSPMVAGSPTRVVARNITSPKPFSIQASDNRFVHVDLVARDERASSRGFKAVDLQMNLTVPYRYRLTTRQ